MLNNATIKMEFCYIPIIFSVRCNLKFTNFAISDLVFYTPHIMIFIAMNF